MSATSKTEAPEIRLRRRAMDLLARREHTYTELQQKLIQRFPDQREELITEVLDRLREENLQSDERFLESYLNTRLRAGMGPLKVRLELQQKGVRPSEADRALSDCPDELWLEQAVSALQRRFPQPPESMEEKQKAWRFLQQRGFESDMIKQVMRSYGEAGV